MTENSAATVAKTLQDKHSLTPKETLLVEEVFDAALHASGEFSFWGYMDEMPMDNWGSKRERAGVLSSLEAKGVAYSEIDEIGDRKVCINGVAENGDLD